MAVYAIGDIQGCYDEFVKLLKLIRFDQRNDQIWLAGDLVNRGPRSADVIRYIKNLNPEAVRVVLGNHDLHLLASVSGNSRRLHRLDTIDDIIQAPDRDELVDWLRNQSLIHHDAKLGFSMVHAGLPTDWTISKAKKRALEVEAVLKSDDWQQFFKHMYGNEPDKWTKQLSGWERLRYITNCFTRIRYCHQDGRLALKFKGKPDESPEGQLPWFEMPNRKTKTERIVFGHWSALGTGRYGNVFSLDSGVVWGDQLTALRIDKKPYEWFTVKATSYDKPIKLMSAEPSIKAHQ